MNKIFISTAIPYANQSPHLGFALETIQADVIARYYRSLAEEVFFLSGSDENSLKNVQAAEKEKITTKKLVDRNAKKFLDLKKALNLSFDDFIRTTEKRHVKGAQKLWSACKDDIYKKKYKGLYCVGCEEFYKESELDENGFCPEHKKEPDLIEEENYFFKLSKYQKQLREIIEKDIVKVIPQTRKNELLSFIDSGLKDFCISRIASRGKGWGIPVPDDSSQVLWTWYDALSNYINALDYADNDNKFKDFWQKGDNKTHVIGKGIIRFHGIYWIAMLLSAGISLPNRIFVHGYITVDGQKMSKSLGNVIDPFELVDKYGTDAVRYYLLREISSSEDGDFTYEKFEERYNADLASGIGNLLARVRTMADRVGFKPGSIKDIEPEISRAQEGYRKGLEEFKFNESLKSIWELIAFCDKYIDDEKPWEHKDNSPRVIDNLLIALDNISELLRPFLPETAEKIKNEIKRKNGKFISEKSEALFPRLT